MTRREQIIEIIRKYIISFPETDFGIVADAILALFENDCTCGGYPDCICGITRSAIKQKQPIYNHNIGSTTDFAIEQSENKSAEEILSKVIDVNLEIIKANPDGIWGLTFKEALKAMEEYTQSRQPEISDEEIEKYYPVSSYHQMDTGSWNNRLRQEGAKAYRDGLIKNK